MEVIAIHWLELIIGLAIRLIITVAATVAYYRVGFSKKGKALQADLEKAEQDAANMLGEAQKTGENRKRELLLQAKEEIHKTRLDFEKDVREKKTELQRER